MSVFTLWVDTAKVLFLNKKVLFPDMAAVVRWRSIVRRTSFIQFVKETRYTG